MYARCHRDFGLLPYEPRSIRRRPTFFDTRAPRNVTECGVGGHNHGLAVSWNTNIPPCTSVLGMAMTTFNERQMGRCRAPGSWGRGVSWHPAVLRGDEAWKENRQQGRPSIVIGWTTSLRFALPFQAPPWRSYTSWHTPVRQYWLLGHLFPQPPQFSESRKMSVSQPVERSPSQLPNPLIQEIKRQTPEKQPATAFCNAHGIPHPPQLLLSISVSTQPSAPQHVPPPAQPSLRAQV